MIAPFSCLLCFYADDDPGFLHEALESLSYQTWRPNEIILFQDGPVSLKHQRVVEHWLQFLPIHLFVNEKNMGLGYTLNQGVLKCSHDLVARMDADDICYPQRFEKQVSFLIGHPRISAVSSWIAEFEGNIDNILSYRKLPESSEELYEFAKSRCPLNHPAVMFRKRDVLAVGNYDSYKNLQDYQLWVKLLVNGYNLYNIQEPLLYMRISHNLFKRRGGINYLLIDYNVQRDFLHLGFLSYTRFLRNIFTRTFVRLVPNFIREIIYFRLLR